MVNERILLATLRPYLAGSVEIPEWIEPELVALLGPGVVAAAVEKARARETLPESAGYFTAYRRRRGMSVRHDWHDWLGGYPYEVARPERVLDFFARRGCTLENSVLTKRHGCNQFVFRREDVSGDG